MSHIEFQGKQLIYAHHPGIERRTLADRNKFAAQCLGAVTDGGGGIPGTRLHAKGESA